MTIRTQRRTVVFSHPFQLKGIGRALPPGDYEVVTDEELIEGLSFAVYRRISTAIIVFARSHWDLLSKWWRSTTAIFGPPGTRTRPRSNCLWPKGTSKRHVVDFDEAGLNRVQME
jgi:hypothetical protein